MCHRSLYFMSLCRNKRRCFCRLTMNFSNFCAFVFNGFDTFNSVLPSSLACWFYNETINMFFLSVCHRQKMQKKNIYSRDSIKKLSRLRKLVALSAATKLRLWHPHGIKNARRFFPWSAPEPHYFFLSYLKHYCSPDPYSYVSQNCSLSKIKYTFIQSPAAMFLSWRNWPILRAVWAGAFSWWSIHAWTLWIPEGSASCHALISRGAEECLCRRFGSLLGLGVEIRKEQCLEYWRTQWASF